MKVQSLLFNYQLSDIFNHINQINPINHCLSRSGGSSDNSYDIIKAHGGEIKVNTKEGESAEFIIQLPAI